MSFYSQYTFLTFLMLFKADIINFNLRMKRADLILLLISYPDSLLTSFSKLKVLNSPRIDRNIILKVIVGDEMILPNR